MTNQKREISDNSLLQFIRFGLVGVCNTIVSYVVYSVCYYLLDLNFHISNFWGFMIGVMSAYCLQSRFVFHEDNDEERTKWWKVLIKTYSSYAFTGLVVAEILLIFWLDLIDISRYLNSLCGLLNHYNISISPTDLSVSIVPFLNMFITVPLNFCINKFWAYKK